VDGRDKPGDDDWGFAAQLKTPINSLRRRVVQFLALIRKMCYMSSHSSNPTRAFVQRSPGDRDEKPLCDNLHKAWDAGRFCLFFSAVTH
jgi:hypothetical protein